MKHNGPGVMGVGCDWWAGKLNKVLNFHHWVPDEIHLDMSLKSGALQPHEVTCPVSRPDIFFLTLLSQLFVQWLYAPPAIGFLPLPLGSCSTLK